MPPTLAVATQLLECLYKDAYMLELKGATSQEAKQLLGHHHFAEVHPLLSTIHIRAAARAGVIPLW